MGNFQTREPREERVLGLDTDMRHVRLKDVWECRKDIENLVNYSREFLKHHFTLPNDDTDFEAEIMYAKKLLAIIKPYSPVDLDIPEFKEKPPAFGDTFSKINKQDYNNFLLEMIEYVSAVLSRVRIIPFDPVEIT